MLEGKAMIQDTDMPVKMQLQAMSSASKALDLFDVLDCNSMACYIKKVSISLFITSLKNLWKRPHLGVQELRLLNDATCRIDGDTSSSVICFFEGLSAIEIVRAETLDRTTKEKAAIFRVSLRHRASRTRGEVLGFPISSKDNHTEIFNADNALGHPGGMAPHRTLFTLVPKVSGDGACVELVDTVSGRRRHAKHLRGLTIPR
ncbi:hypothetical protein BHM03_00018327 [Ensete ventricosum]|nr:hypothetical protein BHM03_00018327 [Ensete ventricosum]